MELSQIKSIRNLFLIKLYETTGADMRANPVMYKIGTSLGLTNSDTNNIAAYLNQKGLIKILTKDRDISITANGIDEVERLLNVTEEVMDIDDFKKSVNELNIKLDKLSMGQEVIYTDIMEKLNESGKINSKDFYIMILSLLASKGLDLTNFN